MKTVLALLLVLTVGLAVHEIRIPGQTLDGLRQAIHSGDRAELEERVDFDSLRRSMKAEIHDTLLAGAAGELEANPFGAIAMGVASLMVDQLVDWTLTPSGLAHLASGGLPSPEVSERRDPDRRPTDPEDLFPNARIERERLHRFSVWVPSRGGDIRWIFRREGIHWRLTSIELPGAG